jgi:endonuclease/exonuclease/phosphatase family metal-dependent hydrolase|nr:endonuclease/exonuclease/phosphatase family protein [Candidatus Krumholzibacteria bacterium]
MNTTLRSLGIILGMMALLGMTGCIVTGEPAPPVLFSGQYAMEKIPAAESPPDSLLVVSYNIAFARNTREVTAQLMNDPHLGAADVLLLQEMDLEGVDFMARALGLNYVYGPAYRHPRYGRLWGNAILSRWPIAGQADLVLPYPNPFSENRRRAVAADVLVKGRKVRAVSVHLSTAVIPLSDRLKQAAVLADSLGQVSWPVIVGGDFNTGSRQEIKELRQVMRGRRFRQVRLPAGKTALGGALDFFNHTLVLDHFFFRGLAWQRAGIADEYTASDHFPVWAEFRFPEEQPKLVD